MLSQQKKIQHLLLRSGFICSPSDIANLASMTQKQVADKIWADSQASVTLASAGPLPKIRKVIEMTSEEKKEYLLELAKEDKYLNLEWLKNMISTQSTFREKMTLFWHGHFASRSFLPQFAQSLNNLIRQNALGKFSDLLTAVSKSPAMLQFLNNQQNKKTSPNENFAREVMELFTMGRGNYTEDDIKNAARAFTGWRFNLQGEFEFAQRQHDDGIKTFLGKTGNFNGDDILNTILQNPATADFIVRKIYKYFVNENIDESICKSLADNFRGDYDIGRLMYSIFTSSWFYDEKNVGTKIKSPVELIVNLERTIPLQPTDPNAPLYVERVLGQVLFFPPNVAGWKGGKDWIDSSSLMFRLSLAGFIFNQADVNIRPKEDPDEAEHKMMQREEQTETEVVRKPNKLAVTPDWTAYINTFKNVADENLYDTICEYLIQVPEPKFKKDTILEYVNRDSKEEFIKSLTVALMSTPEYQMC
ncbi:MAG TPA: DUF1800 domain-containing protein [Bacteroidia bacterium]|jgi:uncharacterized protein (DUF1800 family)|nr:DUF1800 domain-containing protein [Bacteroidia bacterium]